MELMLKDGDYVPDGQGGFRRAEGRNELLQRVLWKLTARRGAFPFLPELGSRLYLLGREKPSHWQSLARQYVAEALADEAELSVLQVEVERVEESLRLTARLAWRGEDLEVKLDLEVER